MVSQTWNLSKCLGFMGGPLAKALCTASLPAAHIANPSFSWHKLGLATCRGIVVKPNKFATFWGIGKFLDFFFSSRSRISCIQMRMQQQDCWRFPSLVAEQLLALFQDLAGPQAFHLQTNQLAQGRSLFGGVIYEQLRASDSSQTLLVLSLSPHLPFALESSLWGDPDIDLRQSFVIDYRASGSWRCCMTWDHRGTLAVGPPSFAARRDWRLDEAQRKEACRKEQHREKAPRAHRVGNPMIWRSQYETLSTTWLEMSKQCCAIIL